MKTNLLLSLLMFALSVACSPCLGDNGSARRYADFKWYDDLFLEFCLLERGEVQHELKMTAEQIAKVKHIPRATAREIPGLMELLAKNRKRQSDPTLSASDKKKLGKAASDEMISCTNAYQRKELSATLSASQKQRLGELVIQMRGPIAIVDDLAVSSKLQLSDKQKTSMKETVKDYGEELKWLQGRYGRQQISGLHKDETREDRQKELEALFVVIRAIEKERDADLLLELTSDQLALWQEIQGKPLPIAWPPTSVSDSPFDEQEGKRGHY